jgi:glycosyltransferase involved in cell wall biosynthesis
VATDNAEFRVLLVTLNSCVYLDDQLFTIANQIGVKVKVSVLDLGSTDGTLTILAKWKNLDLIDEIFSSPAVQPKFAFLQLLNLAAKSEFYAFCDHDDLWHRDKLRKSLSILQKSSINEPMVVGTYRRGFYSESEGEKYIRNFRNTKYSWKNALIENVLYGNTISFNLQAKIIISQFDFRNAVMHDSFIYLYFSLINRLYIIEEELVLYRLHSGNYMGMKRRDFHSVLQNMQSMAVQVREVRDILNDRLPIEIATKLDRHLQVFYSNNLITKVISAYISPAFRQKRFETLLWKFIAPFSTFLV